jgi:hypothetical protein
VALEEQLRDFRDNKTRYAFQSIDELGRHHFIETIREIAAILSAAVTQLVDTKVTPDLRAAIAAWLDTYSIYTKRNEPYTGESLLRRGRGSHGPGPTCGTDQPAVAG